MLQLWKSFTKSVYRNLSPHPGWRIRLKRGHYHKLNYQRITCNWRTRSSSIMSESNAGVISIVDCARSYNVYTCRNTCVHSVRERRPQSSNFLDTDENNRPKWPRSIVRGQLRRSRANSEDPSPGSFLSSVLHCNNFMRYVYWNRIKGRFARKLIFRYDDYDCDPSLMNA